VDAIRVQGRLIGEAELSEIRRLREAHPEWSRSALSVALAQSWQWCNHAGRLKDMAARTLLRKLQARGLITLPPPHHPGRGSRRRTLYSGSSPPPLGPESPPPLEGSLAALRPVSLELAQSTDQRRRIRQLLEAHHYRGFGGAVGQNVQYLIRDRRGRELAVMIFGAAAWKVAPRDRFIGWTIPQRRAGLHRIANQQRFLILPWVRVPQLASHLLRRATQRVSADWQQRYGHPIALLESFVDRDRFQGTTYRAAGWIGLGLTTGRTRQDRHHRLRLPPKSVWVRPLQPRFREHLLRA
jgi:hypothetical protein